MVLIPSSSQFISKAHTAMTQQKPFQWLDGKKHSRWTIKWLISPASMIKCIAGNRWVFFRKTKTKPNAAHDKSSGCAIECARILTKSKPTVLHADDFVLRSSADALTPKKKWANTTHFAQPYHSHFGFFTSYFLIISTWFACDAHITNDSMMRDD